MAGSNEVLRREDARRFVEALEDLPLDRWLVAAATARRADPARSLAMAALEELLRTNGAALEAWFLTDAIDTAAWARIRQGSGVARSQGMDAARVAALAILLRHHLGERWFSVLYEPFASVLPLGRRWSA